MAGSSRLIDVGGGMVKMPREREPPLDRSRGGVEVTISAVWLVVGKPSDLSLVQRYAQRLGVSIHWEQPSSTVIFREKKKVVPESDMP